MADVDNSFSEFGTYDERCAHGDASVPADDTGTGADDAIPGVTASDAGVWSDTLALADAGVSGAETGAGTETITIGVQAADSAALADAGTVDSDTDGSDSGTWAAETIVTTAAAVAADSAICQENWTIEQDATAEELGTSAETWTIDAEMPIEDAGAWEDTGSAGGQPEPGEDWTGEDAGAVSADTSSSDSGAWAEACDVLEDQLTIEGAAWVELGFADDGDSTLRIAADAGTWSEAVRACIVGEVITIDGETSAEDTWLWLDVGAGDNLAAVSDAGEWADQGEAEETALDTDVLATETWTAVDSFAPVASITASISGTLAETVNPLTWAAVRRVTIRRRVSVRVHRGGGPVTIRRRATKRTEG